MRPLPVILLILAVLVILKPASLIADDVPFALGTQYSVEIVMINDPDQIDRMGEVKGKRQDRVMFVDNGKVRLDWTDNGRPVAYIVRPDLQIVYEYIQQLEGKKEVYGVPYSPDILKPFLPRPLHGEFQLIGPSVCDGLACNEYRYIPLRLAKSEYVWVDAQTHAPVKMMAVDGSFTTLWQHYKAGPQNPVRFELPPGYTVLPQSPSE